MPLQLHYWKTFDTFADFLSKLVFSQIFWKKEAAMLQWTRGPSVYEPKKAGAHNARAQRPQNH
jgi:hypothetical protein